LIYRIVQRAIGRVSAGKEERERKKFHYRLVLPLKVPSSLDSFMQPPQQQQQQQQQKQQAAAATKSLKHLFFSFFLLSQ